MLGVYEVQEFSQFGKVMVCPKLCDGCGKKEKITPLEVGTCASGDEIDGCDQLVIEVENEKYWYHILHSNFTGCKDFCAVCFVQGVYLKTTDDAVEVTSIIVA